jgi:hypothetical protein
MSPFLLGGMIGVALAFLNFLASVSSSSRIASSFRFAGVALVLGGFAVRLTLLGLIFYGLSRVKEIHLPTVLISFAAGFTVCLVFKAIHSYRKLGSIKPEPRAS